jgi:SAM-dependent methyltransferase
MSDWKDIWNRRTWRGADAILAGLIEADGFDQGASRITVSSWERYTDQVSRWLKVERGNSIFDVGCGSGALLYPFYRSGHKVGGIDYSEPLIAVARQTMERMDFSVEEAHELSHVETYDFVISNSAFHYFPDLNYADIVFQKMIKKAKKAVAVLEIPNNELKDESENARAAALPEGEYEKKYCGLHHLYYDKQWFEKTGLRYGCVVQILDQRIEDYGNNRFRFNAIFQKKA